MSSKGYALIEYNTNLRRVARSLQDAVMRQVAQTSIVACRRRSGQRHVSECEILAHEGFVAFSEVPLLEVPLYDVYHLGG